MKIVKSFGARRLPTDAALVFLDVTEGDDGYYAEMTGECDDWRDGPFSTAEAAEARLTEHVVGLGMNPDPKASVVRVMDAGHRSDDGRVVGISRDELANIFARAKAAAEAFKDSEDGGTCNFDAPAFRIDGAPAMLIEGAAEQASISVTDFKWFGGQRWFWLHVMDGQGNRRTRMAEAATKVLKEAGLEARTYYQVD